MCTSYEPNPRDNPDYFDLFPMADFDYRSEIYKDYVGPIFRRGPEGYKTDPATFGIVPRKKWDESRWRVLFSSAHVKDFLKHPGLPTGVCARAKNVPDVILRSPKSVVAAFLRAYYDCDGYAGRAGVIHLERDAASRANVGRKTRVRRQKRSALRTLRLWRIGLRSGTNPLHRLPVLLRGDFVERFDAFRHG